MLSQLAQFFPHLGASGRYHLVEKGFALLPLVAADGDACRALAPVVDEHVGVAAAGVGPVRGDEGEHRVQVVFAGEHDPHLEVGLAHGRAEHRVEFFQYNPVVDRGPVALQARSIHAGREVGRAEQTNGKKKSNKGSCHENLQSVSQPGRYSSSKPARLPGT